MPAHITLEHHSTTNPQFRRDQGWYHRNSCVPQCPSPRLALARRVRRPSQRRYDRFEKRPPDHRHERNARCCDTLPIKRRPGSCPSRNRSSSESSHDDFAYSSAASADSAPPVSAPTIEPVRGYEDVAANRRSRRRHRFRISVAILNTDARSGSATAIAKVAAAHHAAAQFLAGQGRHRFGHQPISPGARFRAGQRRACC